MRCSAIAFAIATDAVILACVVSFIGGSPAGITPRRLGGRRAFADKADGVRTLLPFFRLAALFAEQCGLHSQHPTIGVLITCRDL
jgi:hypothetical protein